MNTKRLERFRDIHHLIVFNVYFSIFNMDNILGRGIMFIDLMWEMKGVPRVADS